MSFPTAPLEDTTAEGHHAATANPKPGVPDRRPELLGYSTLIEATYSNVVIEDVPNFFSSKPSWRIRFDDRESVDGRLVDVVLNNEALKNAKQPTKRKNRRHRHRGKEIARRNEDLTKEEKTFKIAEIDQKVLRKYTAEERDEAYRKSVKLGNRPPYKDLAALPEWVQQAIIQQQSSSVSRWLMEDKTKLLPDDEIEHEPSADNASSTEIEPDAGEAEDQPSHVMRGVSTMKQHVTVSESQLTMRQAFAERENFTQPPDEQQHQHNQRDSSLEHPPHDQQSSPHQNMTANKPAPTSQLPIEKIVALIKYGRTGQPAAQPPQPTMSQPPAQLSTAQETAIQEMLADFCAKPLWHRYCMTPPASNATPEFRALTSNRNDDRGLSVPTHEAPGSFRERALRELNRLFGVCRPDRRLLIMRVIHWPDYLGQDVHALLAEEVMWVRGPYGPWSKVLSLGEVGLLLECVGIEDKGSIWKG
jgi:hypothetical protein